MHSRSLKDGRSLQGASACSPVVYGRATRPGGSRRLAAPTGINPRSGNVQDLVRLQRQPPLRMLQAVRQRQPGVALALGAVHRLQDEMPKIESLVLLRFSARLRKDQLQLVAMRQRQL